MNEMCFSSVVRERRIGKPGFAHLPELRPGLSVVGLHRRVRVPLFFGDFGRTLTWLDFGIATHPVGDEVRGLLSTIVVGVGVELDEEHRIRPLGEHPHDVRELAGVAREVQEDRIHHLDRGGVVFEDHYHVLHRVDERIVGQQRHGLRLGDGFERNGGLGDDPQRPFASGEEASEVHGSFGVDVVGLPGT